MTTPKCLGTQIWQIYPPVLTSTGQDEFKFGRSTSRSASRSIPPYSYLVVKISSNLADLPLDLPADLPPVLTSSGPEWQFHIATDI